MTARRAAERPWLAKALATESELKLHLHQRSGIDEQVRWGKRAGIREIFRKAKQAAPAILFFDEIDSVVPHRTPGEWTPKSPSASSAKFLTELDGIEEFKGVLVLAATNRPDIIDPALLRPGRFEPGLELPAPDEQARQMIFRVHTRREASCTGRGLQKLAKDAVGFTGAEIEAVCQESCHARNSPRPFSQRLILEISVTMRHLHEALDSMQPQVAQRSTRAFLPSPSTTRENPMSFTDERGATKAQLPAAVDPIHRCAP